MSLTADDRLSIHELIALHGHLMDNGEFDRLNELFTADVVYDVGDFGFGELHGIDAIRQSALALGDGNPLGHHVTNVVITEAGADVVHVIAKGIGIQADGRSGSVSYEDVVMRTAEGWRIARRKVLARRKPLNLETMTS